MQKTILTITFALLTFGLAGCNEDPKEKQAAADEQLRNTFSAKVKPMPKPRPKDPSHW